MSVLKIEDPTHIQLPKEVGERLGLEQGDVILITIEAQRVILEKRTSSPVDASFALWVDLPPGPTCQHGEAWRRGRRPKAGRSVDAEKRAGPERGVA